MNSEPEDAVRRTNRLGLLLRQWRATRHASQLTLATNAGISQRHLSFVESGRAQPSREMVVRIGEALDVPLRARNELLTAAGFAALYPERELTGTDLACAHDALDLILRHHEPYPAMVLDRAWNIVRMNAASARIVKLCLDAAAAADGHGEQNFIRLVFDPNGIRPHVLRWERTATYLIGRLRREATADPGSPSSALLTAMLPHIGAPFVPRFDEVLPPTAPLELQIGDRVLRLFNTLTTFGTPQDVTLQELRIEMSFPLDDTSDAFLRELAGEAGEELEL